MNGELIRRDAHPLDERKHNKDEREVLRRERFEIERARVRQFDLARKADEKSELAALLGGRVKSRVADSREHSRLLLAIHPGNVALEMEFGEIDRIVDAAHRASLIEFMREA